MLVSIAVIDCMSAVVQINFFEYTLYPLQFTKIKCRKSNDAQ